MRKIFFIMLLLTAFSLDKANAQRGLNNNSDLRVPVPGNINTTAPFIRLIVPPQPTMPIMPLVPSLSPIATPSSGGLMPLLPIRPAIPFGPGTQFGISTTDIPSSLSNIGASPRLPILPPVSPIPPMPQIRLSKP